MYDSVLLKFALASVLSAYVSVMTYVHLLQELRSWAVGDFFTRNFGFWIVISHFTESSTLSKRTTLIMSLFSYKPVFCLIYFFELFYSASSAIKSNVRDNLNLEKRRENIFQFLGNKAESSDKKTPTQGAQNLPSILCVMYYLAQDIQFYLDHILPPAVFIYSLTTHRSGLADYFYCFYCFIRYCFRPSWTKVTSQMENWGTEKVKT